VMVETREGLDHVAEIASTPGLDGIYVGPSDLSLALGLPPPSIGHPALEEAIAHVRETCEAHGLIAGMQCANGQAARARAAEGFKMVTVGVDASLFRGAIARELAQARAPLSQPPGRPG